MKKYFQTIKDHHEDLIFTIDVKGHITMMNSACSKILGKSEKEMSGKSCLSFFSAHQREAVKSQIRRITAGKVQKINTEIEIRTAAEDTRHYNFQLIALDIDESCREILFIGRNITGQRLFENKIKQYTFYDPKTGLPNRKSIEKEISDRINRAQESEDCFAVIFIQIRRVKMINDALGHPAGDSALRQVAERIEKVIPKHSFLGRFSTNKFTLLLDGFTDHAEIEKVCDDIIASIQKPMYFEKQEFNITGAIGISQYPSDGSVVAGLLKNAGIALRYAKAGTHDCTVFYGNEMNMKMAKRVDLERGLRKAIENNELFLVYQPIIQSATGEINACEALLRWAHPYWGLIPPLEFIPIAEETGMIHSLGKWILKTACKQVKEWQQAGFGKMSASVNVSAYQLDSLRFVQNVKEALDQSGLQPEYLHLELTESVMIDQSEKTVEMMRELKRMGVKISIDDFGTGYSSLSYLKHLPIHALKIDRSFIQNLDHYSPDLPIVHAILTMGHGLGLRVVAEGIETNDQLSMLTSLGCDFVQGYLIEKPLDANRFTGWLEKKNSAPNV